MNSSYIIDTDAGIGTILSNFSTDYIEHVIEDSLNMRFRPFDGPMPNYVDILERQFQATMMYAPDYIEKVNEVRVETYKEIINNICRYYNLNFSESFENLTDNEIKTIAHVMYEIFISRFTEYMMDFFVDYIVRNSDSITNSIKADPNSVKPKETGIYSPENYIDPKYILIHANVNKVAYNMAGYDIGLDTLLSYFLTPNMAPIFINLLEDRGDIYKNYYAMFILDQRYSASVLTNIKLSLQAKTVEAMKVV